MKDPNRPYAHIPGVTYGPDYVYPIEPVTRPGPKAKQVCRLPEDLPASSTVRRVKVREDGNGYPASQDTRGDTSMREAVLREEDRDESKYNQRRSA